jgi:histidyl-tRNA synthetase
VARALISNALTQSLPQKFFYYGPMFRHERPQKGRLRQFHQTGVELIGVAAPLGDVEVIACGADMLDALGVLPRTRLDLNTLGDQESRQAYRQVLVGYFADLRDRLSEDSRRRLDSNPLRILDSKDEGDRKLVAGAPTIYDVLTPEAAGFYAAVKEHLARFGVPFRQNPRIVRGLDYYSHTAFEFVTDQLGAQGTVMGGGRYDGLMQQMGGPAIPAVGWAAGIERLAMLLPNAPKPRQPVAVVPLGGAAEEGAAIEAIQALRRVGIAAEMAYRGNAKRRMERANRIGARAAVIIGSDELARGAAQVKDLATGEQTEVRLEDLPERLR